MYLLADVDIHDNQTFAEYAKKSQDIIKKYGGRYLIRGGKIDHMEGKWPLERVILLEFNDIEKLNECFNSPEYLQIKPIRERSSSSKAVILQGIGANKNSF